VSYTQLSGSSAGNGLLERIRPDTIILDEAHSLRNADATRTKRFLRYLKENPHVKLFAWSGTMTSRSIKDYAPLARHALRDGAPVPHKHPVLEQWAAALDPGVDGECDDLDILANKLGAHDKREGFRIRLVSTHGVITSGDSDSCQASLTITKLFPAVPKTITDTLQQVAANWQRPDGEEFDSPLELHRTLHQLNSGFYYRWRFPRGESRAQIDAWLQARAAWNRDVRQRLAGDGGLFASFRGEGWLVGWLVNWLVGWSVGWLVGRLVGWLVGWLVGLLGGLLGRICLLVSQLVG
jgi:hypothetical protein